MTKLRQEALDLLEKISEDKLYYIVQIMKEVDGIQKDDASEREEAFDRLEKVRRKVNNLDYEDELESYREEKYGHAGVS